MNAPRTAPNDPAQAGRLASRKVTFGDLSRFAVAAVHTRFEAVQWFVWDADCPDEDGAPTVIRQADSFAKAGAGL